MDMSIQFTFVYQNIPGVFGKTHWAFPGKGSGLYWFY